MRSLHLESDESMNITYKNPGCAHSIDSISLFLTGQETPFWSDSLLYFYPQVDQRALANCNALEKQNYIHDVFGRIYEGLKEEIDQKVLRYNAHFQHHKGQIEDALSEAFELDARAVFNDLTGNVTLNPICPRFLKERYFDVFYMNSERGALGVSLHEVIHFYWFYVWNGHFGDDYSEYEAPSLKWILSEMVVESIMSDPRLSSLNPYFPKENGGCIYPYFQNMMVNGSPVLHTIHSLYDQNHMTDFMETSYAYCLQYEDEIRNHIKMSENPT